MHQKNVGLSKIALKNKVVYKLALGSLPSHLFSKKMHQKNVGLSKIALKNKVVYK